MCLVFAVRARCWLTINLPIDQGLQVISCNVAFCPVGPQRVVEHGVIHSHLQAFTLASAELPEAPVSPFLQPVQVPPKNSLAPRCRSPFSSVLFTKLQRVHPALHLGPEYINPTVCNVLYDLRKRRLRGDLNGPFTYLMERYGKGGPDFSEVCCGMVCLYFSFFTLSNTLFECLKMFSAFWSSFYTKRCKKQ